MWKLFECFIILCTDFDYILEKSGETIKEGVLFKGGYELRKYGRILSILQTCHMTYCLESILGNPEKIES